MRNELKDGTITGQELCKLTGIAYRKLDYYTRKGIFPCKTTASGSGSRRVYTLENLIDIVRITERQKVATEIFHNAPQLLKSTPVGWWSPVLIPRGKYEA